MMWRMSVVCCVVGFLAGTAVGQSPPDCLKQSIGEFGELPRGNLGDAIAFTEDGMITRAIGTGSGRVYRLESDADRRHFSVVEDWHVGGFEAYALAVSEKYLFARGDFPEYGIQIFHLQRKPFNKRGTLLEPGRVSWSIVASPGRVVYSLGESRTTELGIADLGEAGWSVTTHLHPADGQDTWPWGSALAISVDGTTIIAGSPMDSGTGSAYVFRFDGQSWSQTSEIMGNESESQFGKSVAILDDGRLVIGAPGADGNRGRVYILEEIGGIWTRVQEFATAKPGEFGTYTASYGPWLALGFSKQRDYKTVKVFIYHNDGTLWSEVHQLKFESDTFKGPKGGPPVLRLAFDPYSNPDAPTLVIGRPNQGVERDNGKSRYSRGVIDVWGACP